MKHYDLELIDVNENIENFKFTKVNQSHLEKIKKSFLENSEYFEFSSNEGEFLFQTKFFRGLMYTEYAEPFKTTAQENKEDSVEISVLHNLSKKNKEKKNG